MDNLAVMPSNNLEYYKKVADNSRDLICVHEPDGTFKYVSPSVKQLLGYSPNELVGRNPRDFLFHPDDLDEIRFFHQRNLKGDSETPHHYRIKHKDGHYIQFETLTQPVVNNYGWVTEMITNSRNITERIDLADKLIQKNYELEVLTQRLSQQNKQLEDFANIISHNLRSPIGNIVSLVDIYEAQPTVDNANFVFKQLQKASSRLLDTILNLNEIMDIRSGLDKKRENISFEEVLDNVKVSIASEIFKKKAQITTDFSKAEFIYYPMVYLESILLNLLTNALKYSSSKRRPEIHFETGLIDDRIYLICRDNGLGIDLKKQGHKLFGFHKTFHENPDAKGVGLFITKTQVEAMGGEISATSEVDKGTTFKVIF